MNDDTIPDIGLDSAVKECPYCGNKITPIHLQHVADWLPDDTVTYYAICQCPNKSCNKIFFVKYTGEHIYINMGFYTEDSLNVLESEIFPYSINDINFDENIIEISPDFIEVYKQALLADKMNLDKIAGSGFRLALEKLIKDFAAHINPEKADEIKNDTKVSNVINNRIPDKPIFDDLKNIANRAWWLGCDSSHYNKNYTEFDIDDLKECIDITVATIVYYLKHQHYINSVNKSKV